MRMLTAGLLLVLCAAGWAGVQYTKKGVSGAQLDKDHHHCLGMMQAERQFRRTAPNWHVYDHCMTQRGYERAKPEKK